MRRGRGPLGVGLLVAVGPELGGAEVHFTARQPGVVLELKVLKASEMMERTLATALEQVRAKGYAAELGFELQDLHAILDHGPERTART